MLLFPCYFFIFSHAHAHMCLCLISFVQKVPLQTLKAVSEGAPVGLPRTHCPSLRLNMPPNSAICARSAIFFAQRTPISHLLLILAGALSCSAHTVDGAEHSGVIEERQP